MMTAPAVAKLVVQLVAVSQPAAVEAAVVLRLLLPCKHTLPMRWYQLTRTSRNVIRMAAAIEIHAPVSVASVRSLQQCGTERTTNFSLHSFRSCGICWLN